MDQPTDPVVYTHNHSDDSGSDYSVSMPPQYLVKFLHEYLRMDALGLVTVASVHFDTKTNETLGFLLKVVVPKNLQKSFMELVKRYEGLDLASFI